MRTQEGEWGEEDGKLHCKHAAYMVVSSERHPGEAGFVGRPQASLFPSAPTRTQELRLPEKLSHPKLLVWPRNDNKGSSSRNSPGAKGHQEVLGCYKLNLPVFQRAGI